MQYYTQIQNTVRNVFQIASCQHLLPDVEDHLLGNREKS
jgi:hypothetical protein